MVGRLITDVPGSSAAYVGGWITYANAMKSGQLGVPEAMLEKHGAVSQAVARAMAQGALERAKADLAVAITGIAGPDGGTAEKPVGLVWIGLHGVEGQLRRRIKTDAMRPWTWAASVRSSATGPLRTAAHHVYGSTCGVRFGAVDVCPAIGGVRRMSVVEAASLPLSSEQWKKAKNKDSPRRHPGAPGSTKKNF